MAANKNQSLALAMHAGAKSYSHLNRFYIKVSRMKEHSN